MGIISKQMSDDCLFFINNQQIYHYYRDRLIQVALSQFCYGGLVKSCNREFLEKKFLYEGKAALLKPLGYDDELVKDNENILSLGFVTQGELNIYGLPKSILGIGYNSGNIKTNDFVVAYDNMLRRSIMPYIDMYAKLLWRSHMTILSNQKFQNIPYLLKCSDKDTAFSLEQIFMQLENFSPIIRVRDNGSETKRAKIIDVDVLSMNVDYKGQELWESHKTLWSEACSMLGLTTKMTEKKERLLTDEIRIDRQVDEISLCNRLQRRVDMCNEANEKWGTNITVNLANNEDKAAFPFAGDLASQMSIAAGNSNDEIENEEDE